MKIIKETKPLQVILLLICLLLIIFYFVVDYTRTFSIIREHALWKERIIIPIYFTTISIVLACALLFMKVFFKNVILEKQLFLFFEITVVTNVVVTFLVYWGLLAKASLPIMIKRKLFLDIFLIFAVHLIIPLITVTNFFYELLFLKNKILIKQRIAFFSLKTLVFPLLWLALALAFYFVLGHQKEDAVYGFLDIVHNSIWGTMIFFILIALIYFCSAFSFAYLNNHFSNVKNIKKN